MKRADLVKMIERFGCELVRHGGKHDWYRNPATGIAQPVPRHREIQIDRSVGSRGNRGGRARRLRVLPQFTRSEQTPPTNHGLGALTPTPGTVHILLWRVEKK